MDQAIGFTLLKPKQPLFFCSAVETKEPKIKILGVGQSITGQIFRRGKMPTYKSYHDRSPHSCGLAV